LQNDFKTTFPGKNNPLSALRAGVFSSFSSGRGCTDFPQAVVPTWWSAILSSKVNLPHAFDLRALCGANLVEISAQRYLRTPPCGIRSWSGNRNLFPRKAGDCFRRHNALLARIYSAYVNWLMFGAKLHDLIWTSVYDKYSGSMKITTHLDHIGHCKATLGSNWSNRWMYRVFFIGTRRG
jgi:hypothetical protein